MTTTSAPARLPRNVAKLPPLERAPFVVGFVGEHVEVIAQVRTGGRHTFTGLAVAVALDYARDGHVLVLSTDTGRVLAISMGTLRNIARTVAR